MADTVSVSIEDSRAILRDGNAPVAEKRDVLEEWLLDDNDAAAAFVLDELESDGLSLAWRNVLVFAAEEARFAREEEQSRLCRRLKSIAVELRNSPEPGIERVVWSAARRWATLLPEIRANEIVDFLENTGGVDTRLVALRSIVSLFHLGPPKQPQHLQPLADRIFQITSKLLDADVLIAGETSAIARLGVHAVAAIGDARLETVVAQVKTLGWKWFTGKVRASLVELLENWMRNGEDVNQGQTAKRLEQIVNDLG